jgi:hypothetical protein
MTDEFNKQLAELASKLGISVEHLWGVLVKQAYIDGISSSATTLMCLVHQVRDWYSGVAIKMGRRQGATREHI